MFKVYFCLKIFKTTFKLKGTIINGINFKSKLFKGNSFA